MKQNKQRMEIQVRLFTRRKTLPSMVTGEVVSTGRKFSYQTGKQYRHSQADGEEAEFVVRDRKLQMVYWEEEECWKVSRGNEQSGWGVNVEPVNILQGTRICVEVAWSHQYLGRGSPHCIGLCRPHSWGFWWLQTIIYNEIWKSARRHIFSLTPFTL